MICCPPCARSLFVAFVASGCATGASQDLDFGWQDTGGLDTSILDTLPETTPDPLADSLPDEFSDTLGDTSGELPDDVPVDTIMDSFDTVDSVADTAIEDVGVDETATTCTVADLVTQTMCGATRKCTFISVDVLGVPMPFCDIAGAQGWNQTCGSGGASDNCQAGYICLGSGAGSTSVCRRFCSTDSTCTTFPGGPQAQCEVGISVGGTDVVGVTTCSFSCAPVTQVGCNTDQGCRAADLDLGSAYWTDCTHAGTGVGCVAGTAADCPRGQDCFTTDGGITNECLAYCSYPWGSCSTGSCQQSTGWPSTVGVCF